jgi:hypothetical protein
MWMDQSAAIRLPKMRFVFCWGLPPKIEGVVIYCCRLTVPAIAPDQLSCFWLRRRGRNTLKE